MRFGFEVEIEDVTNYPANIPCITTTEDNSLRNGMEYVSSVLPDSDYAKLVYGYLFKNLQGNYSERCGVHFHMDVTNKSRTERMEFLKRYIQVERTLFKVHSDILRPDNNFCNMLLDSTEELNIIRNYNNRDSSTEGYSKYMSLNIKPMNSIGTFEFRSLKAGVTPEQFSTILDVFEQLWDFSAPLPYSDQITEEDRQEAESVINLINTRPSEERIDEEFMDHHFREEGSTVPTSGISEESIRAYLNSM